MKKIITLFAVAALVLALAPAAQAAPVAPFGPGSYRYAFKVDTGLAATNTSIGFYNGIVDAEGDAELLSDWRVIGSTAADNARDNTGTTLEDGGATDVPIYNTLGEKIWDGNAEMWNGATTPQLTHIRTLAGGNPSGGGVDWQRVWTGTKTDGTANSGNELGESTVTRGINGGGDDHLTGSAWMDIGAAGNTAIYSIYGLSGVITPVAPTVPTIAIGGSTTLITPGDTTPSTGDDTDFGTTPIGGADIVKTYTVTNFATAGGALGLSAPSITGSGAFEVTTALGSTSLAAGESTTFTVTYTAHSGARSVDDATVSLISDAADNPTYTFAITATTTNDGVITTPGDGYEGVYRIAFVTTGKTLAQATNIGFYNDFVTTAAGLITELDDLGVTWKCLGSTSNTSAKVNTSTDGTGDANDVPIYTTTGQRIADNNADLWDGSIQNPIYFDNGTVAGVAGGSQEQAWTGTDTDGTSRAVGVDGSYLGSGPNGDNTAGYMALVRGGYTDGNWITGPSDHDGSSKHLLALSGLLGLPPAGTVIMFK